VNRKDKYMTRIVLSKQTTPSDKHTDDPKYQEYLKTEERMEVHRARWADRNAGKMEAESHLMQEQIEALKFVSKTLSSVEFSLREMFSLTLDDMKDISKAETILRSSFPTTCIEERGEDDYA
tara:strand:- start:59 stop:424 length:366 start_codon:yes stop_codon:yes gene_type:complete